MFAITVENPGTDYKLVLTETATPAPKPREILIKTAATGVNRADLLQAKGKYPPPPGASLTLGLEVSGEVVEAGAEVKQWKAGDKVCALLAGGGYGEYACAAEECVLPVPDGVSVRDAAALPEAFFTAWTNLVDTAHMVPGECVLIHGGSSGIGTAAIQLCTAMGLTVFATAATAQKCAACERLGAVRAINYQTEDFVEVLRERGADVILDMVGGDYIERNFAAAAPKGRIVNIAFQKGAVASVNFGLMLQKRLTFAATTLRGRSTAEKGAIRDALFEKVWPLIAAGRIKPVIDRTFALAEAQAAHAHMAAGRHIGKILLTA